MTRAHKPVSWTTMLAFAERFKGVYRPDAISGAIFRHDPSPSEVVVNITALWRDRDFIAAAESYRNRGGEHAKALFHFSDSQGEVVLDAPLRGTQIIGLTGASSPFDELCDRAGIPEAQRDGIFKKLIDQGEYPGEHRFISEAASQRVVSNIIKRIEQMLSQLHAK